jgi:hypothetical protein
MIRHLLAIVQRAVDFGNCNEPRLGKVSLPRTTDPTIESLDESDSVRRLTIDGNRLPFPRAELPVAAPTLPLIPPIPWQQ